MASQNQLFSHLARVLGPEKIITQDQRLKTAMENTLGIDRDICCIVLPESTRDVSRVVDAANTFNIPIYPISRGRNIGYGDRLPVTGGHMLMDLSHMNRVRNFDNALGTVTLEPGVTQAGLYEYLAAHESKFWMDVTGAGLDSSIVGNTLEGGFGHTPAGFRRGMLSDLEVVCGNGQILHTGDMIDTGPNLSGLFVQSNFGIVTALKTRLVRIPDLYKSFTIRVARDQDLEALVDALRTLRQNGTLTSLVHIANATRSLMSTQPLPPGFENRPVSCEDAVALTRKGVLRVGHWTAIGGLYGSAAEIRAKEKQVRNAVRGFGAFTSFSDRKINRLKFIGRFSRAVKNSLDSLGYVHGLGMGIPNDSQVRHIHWRVKRPEHMGLKWVSPKMSACGSHVRRMLDTASRIFRDRGLEFPVTITLVLPDQAIAVLNITFDKSSPEQTQQAGELYAELHAAFENAGVNFYRLGITEMPDQQYRDQGKQHTLEMLKQVFDPNRIIAPGRYGL